MSYAIINEDWLPSDETKESIKKKHISREQYVKVLKQFRAEKRNTTVENADTVFKNMFDKMFGHSVPKPDTSNNEKQAEERKNNFANKSENSAERAAEIKRGIKYKVGEDQLRQNLAMIQVRFGWTAEQSQEWWDRESKKDSYRPDRPKQND